MKSAADVARGLASAVLLGGLSACGGEPTGNRLPPVPRTLRVVAEPPVVEVVRRTAEDFVAAYPGAPIEVVAGWSREAMETLFAAQAELAVVGREFTDEEREAARAAGVVVEAHRWSRDGLAVVVHPTNPVDQAAFEDLHEIFAGTTISWRAMGGGDRRIAPVVQQPETGASQFFDDLVMAGAGFTGPAVVVENDSMAAARVASDPAAIAFVSLPFADRGVKALRLSRLKGLPYVALDARSVYEGRYPLTRFYNVVLREDASDRARDLNTYMSAVEGQRRVREAGLVPATVPVRFTNRAPTLPAH